MVARHRTAGGGIYEAIRRRAGASGWHFLLVSGANFGVRLLAIAYAVVLARYLEPAGFGIYNEVLAYALLGIAISSIGLDHLATREFSGMGPWMRRLSTYALLGVLGSLPFAASILALGFLLDDLPFSGFVILALTIPVASLAKVLRGAFHARDLFSVSSMSLLWNGVAMTVLGIAAVFTAAPLVAFFWVVLIAEVVGLIYLIGAAARRRWKVASPEMQIMWPILRAAFPYGVIALLGVIHLRVDIAMLGRLAGDVETGYYAGATRFFYVVNTLPGLLLTVLFPRFVRLRKQGTTEVTDLYVVASKMLFWVGLIVGVLGFLTAGWLVHTFYGEAYAGASMPLAVLMVALVFMFVQAPNGTMLSAGDRLGRVAGAAGIVTVLNVVANLVLIPRYGATGASVATLLSEMASAVVFATMACFRIGLPLGAYVRRLAVPWVRREEWRLLAKLPAEEATITDRVDS